MSRDQNPQAATVRPSNTMAMLADAMARASANAPFLRHAIERRDDLANLLRQGDLDAALAWAQADERQDSPIGQALRRQKEALSVALAIGDLAGLLSLEQVMTGLSDFADAALNACLSDIYARRYPGEPVRGFSVIALGKHGGRELNYSSDIDPIFLYDPETIPTGPREDAADAAQRIARQLIELMSARTEHGYVFRTDMRLRPAAEVTPLAIPVNAALSHYESQALTWEQAAFIRARAAAGDAVLGDYFMDSLRPFVWRRSLDFGTIDEIASLTRQIRDHYSEGLILGPGYDLKRGRGGIREVEFFTQAQQLIHGGRDPGLRQSATLAALPALADAGLVERDDAEQLAGHYRLLRTIEHRLQMIDDRQTHSLPEDAAALDRVARLHGLESGTDLIETLRPVVREVADIYDALVASQSGGATDGAAAAQADLPEVMSNDEALLVGQVEMLGFADPERLAARITGWRSGRARALRTAAGRKAFEAILPSFLQMLAEAPDSERALNRFDDLITSLPSTINFFKLLEARPGLMQSVGRILSHALPLADSLARRSDLLDGLIDASAFDLVGSVDELVEKLSWEEPGDDYQCRLDHVRVRVGEMRFALGAQLVEARHDPLDIAAGYARVAEAALIRLAHCAIDEFREKHGVIAGCEPVILALGRLGGGVLTHASDLDLIFLFTGDIGGESDGPRPLGTTHYFNRLAQRIIAAMTVPTAAGALYEIDTRLRPSGTQGLLSVSIDSFIEYQRDKAWTWEHMALCRARAVFGSRDAQKLLDAEIHTVLAAPRDAAKVHADALEMRQDMARHKRPLGPLDAKLMPGGLVDLEFILHTEQLSQHVGFEPNLGAAVRALAGAGIVDPALVEAHDLLTRLLVAIRLIAPDCAMPPKASEALLAKTCGFADWHELLAAYDGARQSVLSGWIATFGAPRGEPEG